MSKKKRTTRQARLRSLDDDQFLAVYARRLARLNQFRALKAPLQILEKEIQLVAEAFAECRSRYFQKNRTANAINEKRVASTR